MPIVETSVDVVGGDPEALWDTVVAFESYPSRMEDVVEVRWIDRAEDRATSAWRVLLNGSELTWVEADRFVDRRVIAFEQVEGDLAVWRGTWTLEPRPSVTRVLLSVEFDLGIPSLAPVMDPLGVRAIRANSQSMLSAIARSSAS